MYKIKFKDTDGHFAIKVRHPGVEKQLLTDFALLNSLSDLMDAVPALHWLGLKDTLVQFAHTLGVQVRLDFEVKSTVSLVPANTSYQ